MDGETQDNVGRERRPRKSTTSHVISWCASHDVLAPPPARNIKKQKAYKKRWMLGWDRREDAKDE
jgi:hypothetical protein